VYTCTRPCTSRVHGRVSTVYTAVYGPCTRPLQGRVRVVNTAVYTSARPCTRPHGRVHGRVHGPYVARDTVVSRVHGTYRAVTRPCTCHEHGQVHGRLHGCVHAPCTRLVHGVIRQCTNRVLIRVQVYTAAYTAHVHSRVHDRVQAVYTDHVQVYTARTRP